MDNLVQKNFILSLSTHSTWYLIIYEVINHANIRAVADRWSCGSPAPPSSQTCRRLWPSEEPSRLRTAPSCLTLILTKNLLFSNSAALCTNFSQWLWNKLFRLCTCVFMRTSGLSGSATFRAYIGRLTHHCNSVCTLCQNVHVSSFQE